MARKNYHYDADGILRESSTTIQLSLRHPILNEHQEAEFARRARVARSLVQVASTIKGRPTPIAILRAAADGLTAPEPEYADLCRQVLPPSAIQHYASQLPGDAAPPPPSSWGKYWNTIIEEGRDAREQLARHNQRLVVHIAKPYTHYGFDLEDLLQEGNLGLARALDLYDERTGYRLSAYAAWWIRQTIRRGICYRSSLIKIPMHAYELMRSVRQADEELNKQLLIQPTNAQIANHTGVPIQTVATLRSFYNGTHSLNMMQKNSAGERSDNGLIDQLSDDSAHQVEDAVLGQLTNRQIRQSLEKLDPRSRDIIASRFGFINDEPQTLEQIGQRHSITRERVRQIQNAALKTLRAVLIAQELAQQTA